MSFTEQAPSWWSAHTEKSPDPQARPQQNNQLYLYVWPAQPQFMVEDSILFSTQLLSTYTHPVTIPKVTSRIRVSIRHIPYSIMLSLSDRHAPNLCGMLLIRDGSCYYGTISSIKLIPRSFRICIHRTYYKFLRSLNSLQHESSHITSCYITIPTMALKYVI